MAALRGTLRVDSKMPKRPPLMEATRFTMTKLGHRSGVSSLGEEFRLAVSASDSDVVVLTETKLDPSLPTPLLFDDSFQVYRCDRSAANNSYSRGGGGALMACTRSLTSREYPMNHASLKLTCVVMHLADAHLFVVAVYLPPYARSTVVSAPLARTLALVTASLYLGTSTDRLSHGRLRILTRTTFSRSMNRVCTPRFLLTFPAELLLQQLRKGFRPRACKLCCRIRLLAPSIQYYATNCHGPLSPRPRGTES